MVITGSYKAGAIVVRAGAIVVQGPGSRSKSAPRWEVGVSDVFRVLVKFGKNLNKKILYRYYLFKLDKKCNRRLLQGECVPPS